MFLDFFDLHAQPFGVTPDPAYLYPSQTHCEALDALSDGIQSGRGFLALVAEPGMGKTTLLYQVLEALRDKARTAFLFQTQCSSREFFQYLLSELGIDSAGMGLVAMHNKLNEILFAEMLAGRRFVLIVDEAQNLDETVLETIRLLSNFETTNTKLLQIVLAGQPQLGEKLKQKQLAQLLQRLTVVKHLAPFSVEETSGYIRHRLKVAGHHGEDIFSAPALELIIQISQGIPRNINRICYQALMEAHADGQRLVSAETVERAGRKLELGVRHDTPGAAPAGASVAAEPLAPSGAKPPEQKPLTVVRSRGWHVWSGVFIAVLLAAMGLGTHANGRIDDAPQPRSTAREHNAALGERDIAPPESARGAAHSEAADYRLQTHGIDEAAPIPALAVLPNQSGMVDVSSIQVSSTANDARVTVLLDGAVRYNSARITGPERIYFDLHNARLNHSVGSNGIPLQTGLVKWVRAAQNTDDVVRLVLDASGAKAYSAQMLPNPYRLVIQVHAHAAGKGGLDAQSPAIAHASWNSTDSGGAAARPTLSRALGLKISRIVIDPGHGGFDTGAMGPHGLLEKNLCLDVALRLGKLIEQKIPGAEVIYTRKDDTYVPLQQRTAIANNAHADLFISIHANSSDSAQARGVETYYLSLAASPEAMKLAARENSLGGLSLHDLPELIQKITRNEEISESRQLAVDIQQALAGRLELVSRSETNRGVKRAPFVVLTGAKMPAVLSEISFLSNAKDERLLLQSSQRERIAEGLYSGVAEYLDSLNSLPHAPQELVSENGSAGSAAISTLGRTR
jgi:N-acetylmuramoyl-L-alanine amidase/type II secretory pathway predicted ATPase ExeA